MATKKKADAFTFEPLIQGTKHVGFRISGMLLFSDFTDERDGSQWNLPLRARGDRETGLLAGEVVDGKWQMPEDYKEYDTLSDGENPLYVMENGTLTTDPYINGTRNPAPGVVLEPREATPHRDFRTSLVPENIKWPDDKVRKIAIVMKANNPLESEVYQQRKVEKTRRLQANVVKGAKTPEELNRIIEDAKKRMAELAAQ